MGEETGLVVEAVERLRQAVEQKLLHKLAVVANDNHDPVEVTVLPKPWDIVGTGNYAVVVAHPDFAGYVVKVYAPGRPGIQDEREVYRALGRHPAFSECYASGERYLILRRLYGMTLYDCVLRGVRIERQVIEDVDLALAYAVEKGLFPHDVHGKNVLMHEGRGYVVDVSDFLEQEACSMWTDLKRAYVKFYLRTLYKWPIPVPKWLMNGVRKGYRRYKKRKLTKLTSI